MQKLFAVVCVLVCLSLSALAQTAAPALTPGNLPPQEVERIVKAFTANEAAYRQALTQYGFKRDAKLQTIGFGGQVTGEYRRVSIFSLLDNGTIVEKITFFPQPTMANITPEDIADLNGVNHYALESSQAGLYNFTYLGQERIDELDLYVFGVAPKVMPSSKSPKDRLFLGRVWVDTRDLLIVKSKGKGVPETKVNKFPNVETYRANVDGKFWFPVYSYANEDLLFDSGEVLHVKMLVNFTDYKRFGGRVRVIEDSDEPGPGAEDKPDQTPAAAKTTPAPKPTPTPVTKKP